MKLGSLKSPSSLDGIPVVVSRDGRSAVQVNDRVSSLREALENWKTVKSDLEKIYKELNEGQITATFPVNINNFHSPLPRSFGWADGSAFIHHIRLVRKARDAEPPDTLMTIPLMYQGGSDTYLAPTDDIPIIDEAFGVDLEGEVAVITDDVPMGVTPDEALKHIQLFMLCNDVSLRGLVPGELAQGFGFFQSKPSSSFSPFAVTPDELGESFKEGRVHLPLLSELNGEFLGNPNAGAMHFHFGQLIAHAARTRKLSAGYIVGSGTVSNDDPSRGSSCLVEKRMIEKINTGKMTTPFLKHGDTVKIEMRNNAGENIFGTIFQKAVKI